MSLLSKTIETDYLGTYTRYVYDNGHVETDPVGRPVFREDAQRLAGQAARDKLTPMAGHFQAVAELAQTARATHGDIMAAITTVDLGVYNG
jgi:hypothetical protein